VNWKKAAPVSAAFAGAIAGAFHYVPMVWGASIALVLLCGLAVAQWRKDQSKRKLSNGSARRASAGIVL
jgi:hypothetical protein